MPLVDILNYLENSRICNGMSDLSSPVMGLPGANDAPPIDPELVALINKAIAGNAGELDRYGASKGLARLERHVKFYGPAKALAAHWEYARRNSRTFPARNSRRTNCSSSR